MTKIWRPIYLMMVLALVLSLGAALLPFGGNVQAAGGTYYVDASVGGPGSGTSGDPWKTITLALATVPGGDPNNPDVINVAAGTYDAANGETFPLPLTFSNDGVSLIGAGAGTTTIDGGSALTILDINDTGITIQDFTITNSTSNADYGIYADIGGFTISDNTFTNVDRGVNLYISETDYTSDYTVDDILISGNEFNSNSDGVYISINLDFDAIVPGLSATIGDIDILGNILNIGINGIFVSSISVTDLNSGSISVGDIDISDNEMYDGNFGIYFYGDFEDLTDTTVTVGDVTINNNIFEDQISPAMIIEYYNALYWDGTTTGTFGDLVINGNDITSAASPAGIYISDYAYWNDFRDDAALTVGDLFIEGNDIDVTRYGIYLYYYQEYLYNNASVTMGEVSIEGNTVISDGDYGIYLEYDTFGDDMYDNSELTAGDIRIENNVIDAYYDAINIDYEEVASYMEGDSVLLMGDVYIVDNQISSDDNGITLYYDDYDVGTNMGGDAYAELPDYIITGNTFNVTDDGIYFDSYSNPDDNYGNSTVDFGDFLIDDNTFNGGNDGIYFSTDDFVEDGYDYSVAIIGDITITNNEFYNLTGKAIYMDYDDDLGYGLYDDSTLEVGDLIIADNVIDGAGAGIYVYYSYVNSEDDSTLTMGILDITGNDISNVTDDGIYVYYYDIYASNNSTLTVGRALIQGNTIDGSGDAGIYISDVDIGSDTGATVNFENITITTNTISENDYGVYISDMSEDYLVVVGPCNDIVDNSSYGVYNISGYMVDATENWWGDASGPGGEGSGTGDDVSDDVDYRPWRTLPCGEEVVEVVEVAEEVAAVPARLVVRNLRITPTQLYPNQPVTIDAEVVNNGGRFGSMTVYLMINGEVDQSQHVGIRAGSVQLVNFYTYRAAPGAYTVTIGNASAQFSVMSPPQAPPLPPAPPPVFQPVGEGLGTGGIIALVVIGILGLAGIIIAFRLTRRA